MNPLPARLAPEELLRELVKALVDAPAEVRVERAGMESQSDAVLWIHVAPEDKGKVIGKQGATITAIRTLFGRIAASMSAGGRVVIEVANSKTREPV